MIQPPSVFKQVLEGRAALEAAALLAQLPLLRLQASRGSGPLMVLPGFMADDASTWLLRRFLNSLGYAAVGWGAGVNRGPMQSLLEELMPRVRTLATQAARPVQLIGWSRGGILAREMARRDVQHIQSVTTMGTPIQGGLSASSIGFWVLQSSNVTPAQGAQLQREREKVPILCPVHSIYSKSDGVVAWQASIDPNNVHVEHHEVASTHVGMGCNAEVFLLLARLLSKYC